MIQEPDKATMVSSVRFAAVGVGENSAGRLAKPEAIDTEVPALTGAGWSGIAMSGTSGIPAPIARARIGPPHRNLLCALERLRCRVVSI